MSDHQNNIKKTAIEEGQQLGRAGRNRNWLMLSVGFMLIALFAGYCFIYRQELTVIFDVQMNTLFWLFVLFLIQRALLAFRFRELCRPFGADVTFRDAFFLNLISGAVNMISPLRAGIAVRAIFLKKSHGLSYSYIPSLLLGSTVLSFFVGGILILLGNTAWLILGIHITWILWVLAVVLCASSLILIIKPPDCLLNLKGRFGATINRALEGWNLLRSNSKSLLAVCGFHFLIFIVSGIIITFSFNAVHLPLSLPVGISISVVNSSAGTFCLTPANIGLQEWIIAFLGNLDGNDFHSGVAAALLMRAIGTFINFLGGSIGYYLLFIKKD